MVKYNDFNYEALGIWNNIKELVKDKRDKLKF